ncbi:MAG TPA: class F sortase [Candidatus Paceibacterota bacterium]|nr:class F sortase [Candidatus Paceibacterota bacterium]
MNKEIYKKIKLIGLGVLCLASFLLVGFMVSRAVYYNPSGEAELEVFYPDQRGAVVLADNDPVVREEEVEPRSEPVNPPPATYGRIRIPTARIDAKIDQVGVNTKGNISAPKYFSRAGWYRYGPEPGDPGSAIISGHVDNGLALPAVFWNLKDLKVGDEVHVERKDGVEVSFRVTEIKAYPYDAPTDKIFKKTDASLLQLITCTGTWIPELRTRNQRLVVTAEKV